MSDPAPSKESIEKAQAIMNPASSFRSNGDICIDRSDFTLLQENIARAIDKARAEGVAKGRESMREEAAKAAESQDCPNINGVASQTVIAAAIRRLETTTGKES